MKYMITYSFRLGGDYEHNLDNAELLTRAFRKWKPESGLSVLAFVETLSDTGGYVLVEADDPRTVFSFVAKFGVWVESEVVPVIDVTESVPLATASLEWARTSSKG